MYIDTHCHLNFKRFRKTVDQVIESAQNAGVTTMVIPGTDVSTSQKAVEIASSHDGTYAAVGVHPHHAFEIMTHDGLTAENTLQEIESLLHERIVVAVGEIGMDRHVYKQTKYESYAVDPTFIALQEELMRKQIQLAIQYHRALIIHNREAVDDVLRILASEWNDNLRHHAVFHCCEVNESLLSFAKEHDMYIGIDGDITYDLEKQTFIKTVPLSMLVLETDSPFILPEPMRSRKEYPNTPVNIPVIAEKVADVKEKALDVVKNTTTKNAQTLFSI
ncbi:TatD family hydrolase [Candidatus Woesebacteria bacterium]|nr:TatD family hydrolase [Candidatus Woesebacteria bacterium]